MPAPAVTSAPEAPAQFTSVPPVTPAQTLADQYSITDPADQVESDSTPPATPKAPEPKAPAPPSHPKWLVEQATELGLPESALLSSTDDLGARVARESRAARAEQVDRQRAATAQGDRPAAPANPAAPTVTTAPEFAIDWGETEEEGEDGRPVKRKLADDDVHPALVKVLKEQAKQIAQLTAIISQDQQSKQATQERTFQDRLDAAFSRHETLFGKGSAEDVKDTPAYRRRRAVWAEIRAMTPEERGPSVEDAIDRVAEQLFGAPKAQNGKPKGAPAKSAVDEWNQSAVAKPTRRTGAEPPPGRAKAVDGVRDFIREHQSDAEAAESDASIDDFLP